MPKHVNDPFGLIKRMLSSRNRAARFTLTLTILGIILSPLDWALQFLERSRTAREDTKSHGPHLIICGPARSGTTLVYQVLANTLPVAYPRNFTALFSRAPILASRLFTWNSKENSHPSYENYYGKTAGMQSPSEANHLWNQWVDSDSSGFRTKLSSHGADKMTLFFKRFSIQFGLPTLTKNNNANAFADAIAQRLDNAYFICLQRDKRYLAQSLVKARQEINGDISQSYGVKDSAKNDSDTNPISQVKLELNAFGLLITKRSARIRKSSLTE